MHTIRNVMVKLHIGEFPVSEIEVDYAVSWDDTAGWCLDHIEAERFDGATIKIEIDGSVRLANGVLLRNDFAKAIAASAAVDWLANSIDRTADLPVPVRAHRQNERPIYGVMSGNRLVA